VELIADAALGPSTDPYLRDHCINGQLLFPGVMGLEAMAQCSMALMRTNRAPVFENVEFQRPVIVGADVPTTVRVLALAHGDGSVRVAIRTASTGFAHDHFSAVCRWPRGNGATHHPTAAAAAGDSPGGDTVPMTLYGSLFFQAGRFARVQGYRELFSKRCVADIAGGADTWFGPYLPPLLVLGDAGARDAALHSVQATTPQHRLLPVSVAGIQMLRPLTGPCQVRAHQIEEDGRDYVWDLEIVDALGRIIEVWTRARFRAIEPLAVGGEALELLGPYLERRLPALGHAGTPRVLCVETPRHRGCGDDAIRQLLGDGVALHRRPDGKPEVKDGAVSVSHSDALTLAVAAGVPIGCDVETIKPRSNELWRDLLGLQRADVGARIATEGAESNAVAGTRVWTAIESLKKAGAPPDLPLTVGEGRADGWVTLKAGRYRVSTWVPPRSASAIALAVATEDVDA
jgi:enediyne polyketide synthase